MTSINQLFIDAVIVYKTGRTFSVGIQTLQEDSNDTFEPFDLSAFSVRMRILGSAEGDGKILIEKLITQTSDEVNTGIIAEPTSGEFTFVITAEETEKLGLGSKPITLELLDKDTKDVIYTLTEGGIAQGEFNKITIVRT